MERHQSSQQELTATPKKELIDEDNIPTSEPGKW